ncbi:MAG: hypothetical protein H8D62_03370 [Bacteroidetes bacterium]|nr:hypothetical protein [Bacteroidota bacterium]
MKKLKKLGIALLAIGTMSVVFTSCSKEEIKEDGCTDPLAYNYDALAEVDDNSCLYEGCTDPDAENYNSGADIEDHTCLYKGSMVFWYGESTANYLINNSVTALTYYVDNQIVGSSAASVYWTGAPDCEQKASVTITKDLGNVKNKSYTFSVRSDSGVEEWTGVANFTANTCVKLQLVK